MSNLTLYRKYRPKNFKEVLGQDHIVSVLEGAIKEDRPAHAYLFAGSRGTGKTSIARILANELGTSPKDLYEIDGASNRGIDEIRELREGVRTLPFDSRFKVYIIDEVHMLTKEAFNALLKTLEEPPAHVIFILATTELHKVPETIISRCEAHTFKRPTDDILVKQVRHIAKKEGYQIEAETARLLAFLGEGSFRDTIGHLQKVTNSATNKVVTIEMVESITGSPRLWSVFNFIVSILDQDTSGGLEILRRLAEENKDFRIFTKLVLTELRLAMLLKFAPQMEKELTKDMSKEEISFLEDIKNRPSSSALPKILKEFLSAYNDIGYAYLPQLPLEMALIKIIQSETNKN